jgi:hypothetical protein
MAIWPRLALFVEAKCPSQLAFPGSDVAIPTLAAFEVYGTQAVVSQNEVGHHLGRWSDEWATSHSSVTAPDSDIKNDSTALGDSNGYASSKIINSVFEPMQELANSSMV